MEFKQQVGVFNIEGQELGRLERVVIEPKSTAVTHLIIRRGWLAARDKVLSIDRVEMGTEDGIVARLTPDEFEQLPDFEETQYVMVDEAQLGRINQAAVARDVPLMYWLPVYPRSPLLPQLIDPAYRVATQLNIPAGTVAVKEGAKVIARDGKPAGSVEEVLTTDEGEQVTHVLISHGRLVKEKKLIPISWIDALGETEIHLAVSANTIDRLPDYDHA